jgi:signal peptidase II
MVSSDPNSTAGVMRRWAWVCYCALFVVVVALDQWTKLLALRSFQPGETRPVIEGFFNLTLAFNKGVAFGLFADLADGVRHVLLGVTAALAIGAVIYFFVREYAHDWVGRTALVLVFGGAVGNIIDRVRLGMVVDFFDFYLGQYHYPAFNIADSAICVGVVVLIFRRPASPPGSEAE